MREQALFEEMLASFKPYSTVAPVNYQTCYICLHLKPEIFTSPLSYIKREYGGVHIHLYLHEDNMPDSNAEALQYLCPEAKNALQPVFFRWRLEGATCP